MNADRVRMQRAVDGAKAAAAAASRGPLGREWADAIASDPCEVDDVLAEINAARAAARAAAATPG